MNHDSAWDCASVTLIVDEPGNGTTPCSYTLLTCERRADLWDPIQAVEWQAGRDVPETFKSWLGDDPDEGDAEDGYVPWHWGPTPITPYGKPLRWVPAEALLPLTTQPGVQDNWRNRAIWAYLAFLPATVRVALFWD